MHDNNKRDMAKYGVSQQQQQDNEVTTKQSCAEALCPICSRALEKNGAVRLCPVHGSEGLEA